MEMALGTRSERERSLFVWLFGSSGGERSESCIVLEELFVSCSVGETVGALDGLRLLDG